MEEIKNEKINTGIKEIKNIKMTSGEKDNILHNILNSTTRTPKPIHSPWYTFSSTFNHSPYLRLAIYLIVIFGAGGIIITSQNSGKEKLASSPQINFYKPVTTSPSFSSGANTQKEGVVENPNDNPASTNTNAGINKGIFAPPPSSASPDFTQNATTSMSPSAGINNAESQNYINIALPLFENWIKNISKERGDVLDYKINKISFVISKINAAGPEKNWFTTESSNEAFIVSVDYSVKTTEEGKNDYWIAGNGESGGNGWVLNKFIYITIDKVNNVYTIINMGTGF